MLAALPVARRAEHRPAREIHAIALEIAAAVEIEHVACLERAAGPGGTQRGRRARIQIRPLLEVTRDDALLDFGRGDPGLELLEAARPCPAADRASLTLRLDLPFRLDHPAAPDDGPGFDEPDIRQIVLETNEIAVRDTEPGLAPELDSDRGIEQPAILKHPAYTPVHACVGVERHLGIDAPILDPGRVRPIVETREHSRPRPAYDCRLPLKGKDEYVRPLPHPSWRPLTAEIEERRWVGHHKAVHAALRHKHASASFPGLVFLCRNSHRTPRSKCRLSCNKTLCERHPAFNSRLCRFTLIAGAGSR